MSERDGHRVVGQVKEVTSLANPLVKDIKAPLLIHYAENDATINAMWPAFEAALKAGNIRHEAHVYPGTQHGFHNNSTPRYNEANAKLSWDRTVAHFKKYLV